MLRIPYFQKCMPFVLATGLVSGQPVQKPAAEALHFTIHEAIQAEWMRTAPNLMVDALPKADRERYKLTLQRIGAPGMPKLLPPELETPTIEIWEAKAMEAKTPQERFTALHFLNRLKSPKALSALDGLKPEDAKTWPKHLFLDANIATARLQGGEVSQELQGFLDALKKAGKVEPVRAQAARLRLVMAGKERELLSLIRATPGSVLALMDAWNRGPWEKRKEKVAQVFDRGLTATSGIWSSLGSNQPTDPALSGLCVGILQRLFDGLPNEGTVAFRPAAQKAAFPCAQNSLVKASANASVWKWQSPPSLGGIEILLAESDLKLQAILLPSLRKMNSQRANELRTRLLIGSDPIARSAAIEDLPDAPVDLDAVTQTTWKDRDLEPQQSLIESYSRWKLPKEKQIELLKPWLQHPDWACRYLAYQQLLKLDAATPWPTAPEPNVSEKALLQEAERLATAAKPVRLRITFSGKRHVTLRLDPSVAPINIANLAMLARKGFFNRHLVPRVVPDFVVQMGSPYDTMDGGPGYSVRCEDSLNWYGPGSVGMALSGKDTGGSQFFITTNATPHLTGKYTRMGELEDLDQALKILDDLELGARIERIDVIK